MEFTEVVSPTVAVPVLCVLVCAFFVFAFGFKSPVQPPSFDVFEEDRKKRKIKKSKGLKSNEYITGDSNSNVNNNAKLQASPRQTSRQPVKSHAIKNKPVSDTVVIESSKKVKSKYGKDDDGGVVLLKSAQDDIEGWHTVPKKDKKQKKRDLELHQVKDEEPVQKQRQQHQVNEEEIVKVSETSVTNGVDVEILPQIIPYEALPPASPQEQRNKERKEKSKQDYLNVEPSKAADSPQIDVTMETKMVASEILDASIELQLQNTLDVTANMVDPLNDVTANEVEILNDKKKLKTRKDQKKSAAEEDDFVIPEAALKPVLRVQEAAHEISSSLPHTENTQGLAVKVLKKKQKKDKSKRNDQGIADVGVKLASGGVTSNLPQPLVTSIHPVDEVVFEHLSASAKVDDTVSMTENTGQSLAAAVSSVTENTEQLVSVSFDELGSVTEFWTEAKPKSKKKKPRRAD